MRKLIWSFPIRDSNVDVSSIQNGRGNRPSGLFRHRVFQCPKRIEKTWKPA